MAGSNDASTAQIPCHRPQTDGLVMLMFYLTI